MLFYLLHIHKAVQNYAFLPALHSVIQLFFIPSQIFNFHLAFSKLNIYPSFSFMARLIFNFHVVLYQVYYLLQIGGNLDMFFPFTSYHALFVEVVKHSNE